MLKAITFRCLQFMSKTARVSYFDYQATTPIDFRVEDAMTPFLLHRFGNPHSKTHQYGWNASKAVEKARQQIASLIGADSKEIFFTSGATESTNMSLKGLAGFYGKDRKHIITTEIEHHCTFQTCKSLEQQGFKVTYLPVQNSGLLDLQLLQKVLDQSSEKPLCVSVIFVHNEIGVIQKIRQIGQMCQKRNVFFHVDAAQAVGKIPINVNQMKIDLLSMSGHKFYAPKGVGALYLRRKPRVRLQALINGGGQQRGLRSGTLAPALVVGLGKACEVAHEQLENDTTHIHHLYHKIVKHIKEKIPYVRMNGDEQERYKGNISLTFAYAKSDHLLPKLGGYALSSKSACEDPNSQQSPIMKSLGIRQNSALHTTLRIGLGRYTIEEQVDCFLEILQKNVRQSRSENPEWKKLIQTGKQLPNFKWSRWK